MNSFWKVSSPLRRNRARRVFWAFRQPWVVSTRTTIIWWTTTNMKTMPGSSWARMPSCCFRLTKSYHRQSSSCSKCILTMLAKSRWKCFKPSKIRGPLQLWTTVFISARMWSKSSTSSHSRRLRTRQLKSEQAGAHTQELGSIKDHKASIWIGHSRRRQSQEVVEPQVAHNWARLRQLLSRQTFRFSDWCGPRNPK